MRLERTSRPPVSSAPTCSSTRTASRSTACGRSSSGDGGKGSRRQLPRLLLVLVTLCRTWEAAGISFALAHAYISFDIHLKRDPSSRRPGEDSQSFKMPTWPDRCRSWAEAEVILRIWACSILTRNRESHMRQICILLHPDAKLSNPWTVTSTACWLAVRLQKEGRAHQASIKLLMIPLPFFFAAPPDGFSTVTVESCKKDVGFLSKLPLQVAAHMESYQARCKKMISVVQNGRSSTPDASWSLCCQYISEGHNRTMRRLVSRILQLLELVCLLAWLTRKTSRYLVPLLQQEVSISSWQSEA